MGERSLCFLVRCRREFRATAYKVLDEWIDKLEGSFKSNPARNVMDLTEIFSKAGNMARV